MTDRVIVYDALIGTLIQKEAVQYLIGRGFTLSQRIYIPPKIWVSGTCGVNVAGQTWMYDNGESDIELSSWILIDPEQTLRVIRHEFAHTIKEYAQLDGKSHGRGFTMALKAVSSEGWRQDRHWVATKPIDIERLRCHPNLQLKV